MIVVYTFIMHDKYCLQTGIKVSRYYSLSIVCTKYLRIYFCNVIAFYPRFCLRVNTQELSGRGVSLFQRNGHVTATTGDLE